MLQQFARSRGQHGETRNEFQKRMGLSLVSGSRRILRSGGPAGCPLLNSAPGTPGFCVLFRNGQVPHGHLGAARDDDAVWLP